MYIGVYLFSYMLQMFMGMLEKQKENMGEVNKSKALTFWLEESKRFSKL